MSNKIKYGLKNVYYSVITDSPSLAYGAPVAIPGGVSLSLTPKGEKVEFYADDTAFFVGESNLGYEGSLEVALLPDRFKKDVLGYLEDANGALIEDSAALAKKIALMFEFQGDSKATRHVLYNVAVSRPALETETKGETIDPKTDSFDIIASPASDTGYVKAKIEYGQTGYSTFYDAVYTYNSPANSVAPTAETFDINAAGLEYEDKLFTVTSGASNSITNVLMDGAQVGGAYYTIADLVLTVEKEYLATLAVGVHTLTIALAKGVPVTVAITVEDTTA